MWYSTFSREELLEGVMQKVEVGGRAIVVALNQGQAVAFNATCPHASAELEGGDLRPTYVICPLHAYRFDLKSGRCLKPTDGPRLRLYPTEWRDGRLWVEVG